MLFTRSRFRSLALVTAIATIVLFAIGGLVRGTGSGLGCSTWPACEPGHLFPSGTIHSLIEFSHRTMALLVAKVRDASTGFIDANDGAATASGNTGTQDGTILGLGAGYDTALNPGNYFGGGYMTFWAWYSADPMLDANWEAILATARLSGIAV